MSQKPKVIQSSFPPDWKPECPHNYNAWQARIRAILHSEGDAYNRAKVDIARSFDKLKKSINP